MRRPATSGWWSVQYVPNTILIVSVTFEYKVTDGTVTADAHQVTIEMVTDYLWFNGSSLMISMTMVNWFQWMLFL